MRPIAQNVLVRNELTQKVLIVLLCLAPAVTSCSRAPVGELPPVPAFDSSGFLPVIQQQIQTAADAVAADPLDALVNGKFAMVLHAYQQFEPAVELYTRASQLDRKPAVWLYLKAHSLAALSRTTEAIQTLERARAESSDDPWIAATHTLMKRMAGDRSATAADLASIALKYDELPELHYTLARLQMMDENLDAAVAEFERTLELAGPFGAAYYGLGMAEMRRGNEAEAARAIELSRHYKDVVAKGSDPHLARIEQLNLSDIRLIQRAEKALLKGDFVSAASLLTTATERNPKSVAAHLSLLGVYSNTGDFVKAEHHYEKARALEPERAKLFYNLGLLRFMQKRFVEAERAFRDSLQREPDNADAYVQLALTQTQQSESALARLSLDRALELDPANRFARIQLAQMLRKSGKQAEVVDTLEGHYEPPDGGSAQMLLMLSKAYNQLGQKQAAIERASRGIEIANLWQQTILINQFRRQQYLAEDQ